MTSAPFVPAPHSQLPISQDVSPHASSQSSGVDFDQINKSISAVSAATYAWDIASDEITWHGNLNAVFGQNDISGLNNGRAYASLLDPDNFTSRFETVMRNTTLDEGDGVPFSIEYSIKPFGRDNDHSIWVEDIGRWYAGQDGRPNKVFGLVRQIDDRHKRDQHLQFMGNCDPLTGMMNRGRLTEALGESIESVRAQNLQAAFLIVAISNLEVVNDAYGFEVADEVVTSIGKRLRQVVRTGDVIGRYSGSKFGIILAQATSEELEVAAERFLSIAREQVIETELGPVWASLSIGALMVPFENDDATTTMSHAEEALAEAKKQPTDGFVAYAPREDVVSERKLNSRCAVEIVHNLKDHRFTLAYQPIFNVRTQQVEYHEALLRMRCESGEIVPAGHLVPIAEKLGLVRLIDQAVVSNVLTTLRQHPSARIALNISGVTTNDPRWFGKLTDMLTEHSDLTDRLTIEITETVALENIEQTIQFIEKLHSLGCKVAIDDFGAGFTSFRNLKMLKVDKVKIDGSFCVDLSTNPENQYFVKTLIDLAKNFNLLTVAEWVENQQDADLLTSWGVDYLQGRLHGMAQDGSQWGDPIIDTEQICVIPSEIFKADEDTNLDNVDRNGPISTQTPVSEKRAVDRQHDQTIEENKEESISLDNLEEDLSAIAENQSSEIPFAAIKVSTPITDEETSNEQGEYTEFTLDENFADLNNIDKPFQFQPLETQEEENAPTTEPFQVPNLEIKAADFSDIIANTVDEEKVAPAQEQAMKIEALVVPEGEATPDDNEQSKIAQPEEISEIKEIDEAKEPEEVEKAQVITQGEELHETLDTGILSQSQLDDELSKLRDTITFLKPKSKKEATHDQTDSKIQSATNNEQAVFS